MAYHGGQIVRSHMSAGILDESRKARGTNPGNRSEAFRA